MAASVTAHTVATVATARVSVLVSVAASINWQRHCPARPFVSTALVLALVLLAPARAFAGSMIDYIRNYDLNDYSLGIAFSASQSPYLGSSNSKLVYPYLTSFTHSAFTDDWLLLRDENIGIRYVTDSQWELGLVARFQGLGTGIDTDGELAGIREKDWAIEIGPLVGFRAWPIDMQFRTYWDMPNRHDGLTSELEFSLPLDYRWGFLVPAVRLSYLSEEYTDYYYSVSDSESTPTRPAYKVGAATTIWAGFSMGYQLADRWLLKTNIGLEYLDSSIAASPIVDSDQLWSASVGLAYNADIFVPRDYEDTESGFALEIRLGAFSGAISTTVERSAGDGQPQDTTDIENLLGAADNKTFLQLDGMFRINYYHQLQLGYFNLERQSSTTLVNDHSLGDETYLAGTEIETSTELSLLRFSYAYSLMHDGQKELGVKAGISYTRFEAVIGEVDTQDKQNLDASAPLPTIGALGELTLGENWALGADLDLFVLDFSRYSGFMGFLGLDLERRFGDTFKAGVGYNLYTLHLEAKDENLGGELDLRIHGPKAYVSFTF
jgi:outer membrane protein